MLVKCLILQRRGLLICFVASMRLLCGIVLSWAVNYNCLNYQAACMMAPRTGVVEPIRKWSRKLQRTEGKRVES